MPDKKLNNKSPSPSPPVRAVVEVSADSSSVAAPHTADFPIVGIGASAGGLGAFEAFFRHIPSDSDPGMAFVIVQHLSPDHNSLLGELIQRYTKMPVHEVIDGMPIECNHVYTIPPNTDLSIFHGSLRLLELSAPHGIPLPIDHFFRSLSQEKREAAIIIVLSGAGSDGTMGVRAIKEAGGMVMVQTPASAEYDSMPQSALDTGLVDYVLPPEEMPAQLLAYARHTINKLEPDAVPLSEQVDEALQKIFLLLRAHTGHDFSDYKQATILRRIERRMVIHQLDGLAEYAHYLQQTPQEVAILFRELLIGVTRFFRDPEAFTDLKTQAIPALFAGKEAGNAVRAWVPGCSTGEEAFTLAMILFEYAVAQPTGMKVQVFATDIDSVAIVTARAGVYPANIVADLPPDYLSRYFTQYEHGYRVNKVIRDMVVFAEQYLIMDPPFSHMDLISCRNLLIYLNADLQKKLFPLFHYALNPDGFLLLGNSESNGQFTDLFNNVNRKSKIYQRIAIETSYRPITAIHKPRSGASRAHGTSRRETPADEPRSLQTIIEQNLLAQYMPPSVLINESEEVLYIHGSTGRYLEPASGEANLNILRMARPGLRLELSTAVRKAVTLKETVRIKGLKVPFHEQVQTVNLTVSPVTSPATTGLFMVVFSEVSTEVSPQVSSKSTSEEADQRVVMLERELRAKDEYLATNVEELTTANEELQSSNEELQSTNEEMDTSREELQSVNEELSTVNTELQKKIEELSLANDDMNNLLAGTNVGTVFVDRDLCIQRFTPAATAVVHLIPSDIGRPIAHLATDLLQYDTLLQDARRVFETLAPHEMAVQTTDGRWYLMRILPYRTRDNVIIGVVITFVNITTQRKMQAQLQASQLAEQAHAFAESIVDTVREPLLVLDSDLRVVSVNDAFINIFKVQRDEAVGTLLYALGNGQWDIPALHTLLEEILPKQSTIRDYLVTHVFEHIGLHKMKLNARQLRQQNDQPPMILLAIDDVTEETENGDDPETDRKKSKG